MKTKQFLPIWAIAIDLIWKLIAETVVLVISLFEWKDSNFGKKSDEEMLYNHKRWKFGQRCLRIVLDVFEDLIHRIIQWFSEERLSPGEIFQKLFMKMCKHEIHQ